ncbi:MAG TPA: DEAD/DEAH box helicase [Bacteroidales bacterium]|nr:DEAD/DEAH box helicase [Bacteroidales bacterium]HPS16240.1 DEAD/DEAH box helicase [Bacteroidales bacterium]
MTFEELSVIPEICKAIQEMGFENPMPVQEQVIPLLLNKRNDVIALAQTGTGKTAAFGIPLIQEANPDISNPRALVLCPTRELCMQITGDLKDFAKYCNNIRILPVYGGSSIETQINALKKGVQIVVATPGRLIDLLERKAVKLSGIERVVLDEADEMLNMGFLDDINTILAQAPAKRNTMLFSATMPDAITNISRKFMNNPVEITVGSKNAGAENVKHVCYTVHARDKYFALKRIADFNPNIYGIVFCRTRKETQEIADKLIQDGYNADALHGDLSQAQRDSVMQKFRIRNIQLLIATDVAARGLDVDDLTHVINYNLPDDFDVYTHRSGRTGRTGKAGISIAIVNLKEKSMLKQIEKKIKKSFLHATIPTGKEICEKQLFSFIDRMEKVEIDYSQVNNFLPVIFRKLEWLDKEDIICRFVSLEFNRFLEYYKNAPDINISDMGERRSDRKGDRSGVEAGYARLFINSGKMDGLNPAKLIGVINDVLPGEKISIGRIDLLKSYSFFEIEKPYAEQVMTALNDYSLDGRILKVEIASERRSEGQERSERSERRHVRSKRKFGKEGNYKSDGGSYKGDSSRRREGSRRDEGSRRSGGRFSNDKESRGDRKDKPRNFEKKKFR